MRIAMVVHLVVAFLTKSMSKMLSTFAFVLAKYLSRFGWKFWNRVLTNLISLCQKFFNLEGHKGTNELHLMRTAQNKTCYWQHKNSTVETVQGEMSVGIS
jgi:hypothetical protein